MIKILYEDKHIIAFDKPANVLSAPSPSGEETIAELVSKQQNLPELSVVHRLDRNASGVMLLAKNRVSAGKFSAIIAERAFVKEYLAVIHGVPELPSGIYKDLLFRDMASNKTFVVDTKRRGVKEACLEYSLLGSAESEDGTLSLVRIRLHTGRTHQIRVQFASRKTPLFGDGKYGSHTNRGYLALYSARVSFVHPFTKKQVDIQSLPDKCCYPWSLFNTSLQGL